ncbi:MAG: YIP1 family protein [Chloroflexi bacterium]|nr:YIP1 family protein [Chloroflexota bacterium]
MDVNAIVSRLVRVARFDASVYREIAEDQTAMGQAALVVIAAVVLSAIGSLGSGVGVVLIGAVISLVSFVVYVVVATFVSKSFFQGKTDFQEMGRTLGYAYAWYGVGVLGLIPCLGAVISFLAWIAAVVAGVVALRESSEFDTGKAVATVLIAGVVAFVINLLVAGPLLLVFGLASAAAG